MSISPTPLKGPPFRPRRGVRSQALVIVLAMVVMATVLVVAFFGAVRFDLVATSSYSQSLKAEQLGLGGLQLISGQLQQEMNKDVPPDTGGTLGTNTLYTNIPPADIMPQAVGTNSAMPSLLKISTNATFFSGTLGNGALVASTVSTTTPSLNGRFISATRWSQAYMGTFPGNAQVPYWILMTRSGPTNGASASFGSTAANTFNNPDLANTNYVTGRFAYAIYDEGGLLDINSAGYSTSAAVAPSTAQIQTLKGTLAGADLTQVGVDPAALVAWRNTATGADPGTYMNYVTNTAATNGFLQVSPGDRTFLNRQDLIKAAQNGMAGLTTGTLTNLATFTRESTLPSWGPSANAPVGGIYNYASNANVSTGSPFSPTSPNPNRFVPRVRFPAAGTITSYHSNGSPYTYTVQAGDALLQHRFALDRINWLGTTGPNAATGGTAANIQACFGLIWGPSKYPSASYSVWQYVGSNGGSTELSSIETLDQVAAENREPNFFELLQAGILSGSLGVSGDVTGTTAAYAHQYKIALQIFRTGACIIDQYDSDSDPTIVEYSQSGTPWQASGSENLPYVNLCKVISGASEVTPINAAVYFLFGLWNPSQSPSPVTRPNVRLHLQGAADVGNEWGNYTRWDGTTAGFTYHQSFNTTIQLSSGSGQGVNGFTVPNLLTPSDVTPSLGNVGSSGNAWSTTQPPGTFSLEPAAQSQYVGYRLPDFTQTGTDINATSGLWETSVNHIAIPTAWETSSSNPNWQYLSIDIGSGGTTAPTQYYLEYQDASGNWVPYNYASGLNDSANTWGGSQLTVQACKVIPDPAGYQNTPTFSPLEQTFSGSGVFMTSDPRSLRFNPWDFLRNAIRVGATMPDAPNALITPLWDNTATSTTYLNYGYGGGQHGSGADGPAPINSSKVPPLFIGTPNKSSYYPAQLVRNNQANGAATGTPITGYSDNDGIQRIADGGLFTGSSASNLNPSVGDPFQRVADQPVILNRPFNSVAEMGYALRDDPWHSLNFFSANSADSGLLDLFSVREEPQVVATGQTVRAARINLNTKDPAVLAAMLSGTIIDPINNTAMSAATANALALDIVKLTSTTPLVNKDQLVTKLGPTVATTTVPPTVTDPFLAADFSSTDDQKIKAHREAYVRSLADVSQTRTWNLMIDLIAQSGKYPPTATGLSQFVVEGERRYWLHIAIDRLTGQVIAQQLEPVSE
jgi:hypothetical protein